MGIRVETVGNEPMFFLETEKSSYIMTVRTGMLINVWYGAKVGGNVAYLVRERGLCSFAVTPAGGYSHDVFRQECPAFGNGDFGEPMISVEDADGICVSEFTYQSYRCYTGKRKVPGLPSAYSDRDDTPCLDITLKDLHTGVEVTLTYSVFEECDAIVKSAAVCNTSSQTVFLDRCLSSATGFGNDDFDVIVLKGYYATERSVKRYALEGNARIGSVRGSSGHAFNPFMALVKPDTTEERGDAFGTAFIYSGNYTIIAEDNAQNNVRWLVGIHPDGFRWKLAPQDTFYAPEAVLVYSDEGIGGMSRAFHDFCREHITRGQWKTQKRPLLINNWEGTGMDFTGEKIIDIARRAATVGINMMVLDDGWFGARDHDGAGLGDWVANEKKLGMTVGRLAEEINKLGMKFGLWFEPEMVNPDSDLYRVHPEYALGVNGRPPLYGRNQLVLNFADPQVVDNIYNQMCAVLDNAHIEYLKWDFNRNLAQVSFPALGKDRQGEVYHRYMLGLYDLLERLTARYPHILWESCSGGGGRCDFGILSYMQQNWASDNTDAGHRLEIQHGTSMVYPVRTIGSHYTAIHPKNRTVCPETRAQVARFGSYGYELDITKMSDDELQKLRGFNDAFDRDYDVIQFGDLYRLINVFEKRDASAWMFVSKDKKQAVVEYVQVLKRDTGIIPLLRLQGLDPETTYTDDNGAEYLGKTLMNAGIVISDIHRDFAATCIRLTAKA